MEPLNISISELLALVAIKEHEGESLPAKRLKRYIPGSNPRRSLWLSLRWTRHIITSLERKGLIEKQKHKNSMGGDAANSYKLTSPLTPYRVFNSRISTNKLLSIRGLRDEVINYLSHLADKVHQQTNTPWERLFRVLIWFIRNSRIGAYHVVKQLELFLPHGIRILQRQKDKVRKNQKSDLQKFWESRTGVSLGKELREIESKGDYLIACFKKYIVENKDN